MLSRIDIEKELGKNINIYPLNLKNFKENSVNLCAGEYAWTLGNQKVYFGGDNQFSLEKKSPHDIEIDLKSGYTAVWSFDSENQYIILLPESTTLIETKETMAVGPNIGGTYHSKVGIVSQGLGHIGTMLGPNFAGNSLIALHNVTKNLIVINVGDSFVSVVFNYLETPIIGRNATVSGHMDKMAELGIKMTKEEREDIGADWRSNIDDVRQHMMNSDEYKNFETQKKKERWKKIKKFLNWKNLIIGTVLVLIAITGYYLCNYFDQQNKNDILINRYWDVVFSGFITTLVVMAIKSIKPR